MKNRGEIGEQFIVEGVRFGAAFTEQFLVGQLVGHDANQIGRTIRPSSLDAHAILLPSVLFLGPGASRESEGGVDGVNGMRSRVIEELQFHLVRIHAHVAADAPKHAPHGLLGTIPRVWEILLGWQDDWAFQQDVETELTGEPLEALFDPLLSGWVARTDGLEPTEHVYLPSTWK